MDFGVISHKHDSPPDQMELRDEKGHGSANLKHQRSGISEDSWKLSKMQRHGEIDFSSKKDSESFLGFGRSNFWASNTNDEQKMLSFSSSEPHCNGGLSGSSGTRSTIAFSISQDGLRSRIGGGFNEGMRGSFARLRGPFTPSQWMELEHQALIYKHLVANVAVPSNLLLPLKKSLYSYGSYATDLLGWGAFHLGFSGSNDPEPGRCRRTDGKKWRCSRDAVPDQKYCERHINRGRHRSRKPVEGQNGHTASGSTTCAMVASIAPPSSPLLISSSSTSNGLTAVQHQFNSLQPHNTTNPSTNNLVYRTKGFQGLALTRSMEDLKSKDSQPFSVQKQHVPFHESSHSEFGFVSSDSLINTTQRMPFTNPRNPPDPFLGFSDKETNNQQPVHHFIDEWPKDQSDRTPGSWPEELKSDWTQLSMSIPVAPDFSSSSTSPALEKSTIPTLRLSHELNPIHMSLGVVNHDQIQKQSGWSPVSWGNSMGGPLGEVLSSRNAGRGGGAEFSTSQKAWNSNKPQLGSSPIGVLQKSTFVSRSNSSSGSSTPSLGSDLLGSALISFPAIPSL